MTTLEYIFGWWLGFKPRLKEKLAAVFGTIASFISLIGYLYLAKAGQPDLTGLFPWMTWWLIIGIVVYILFGIIYTFPFSRYGGIWEFVLAFGWGWNINFFSFVIVYILYIVALFG